MAARLFLLGEGEAAGASCISWSRRTAASWRACSRSGDAAASGAASAPRVGESAASYATTEGGGGDLATLLAPAPTLTFCAATGNILNHSNLRSCDQCAQAPRIIWSPCRLSLLRLTSPSLLAKQQMPTGPALEAGCSVNPTCGLQNASSGRALYPSSRIIHKDGPDVVLSAWRPRNEPIVGDGHLASQAVEAGSRHHLSVTVLQLQLNCICTEIATMFLQSSTILSVWTNRSVIRAEQPARARSATLQNAPAGLHLIMRSEPCRAT